VYLFFDTETTGIESPRIVQIAWAVTDENGNELRTQSFIVRPVGFEIPASATRIHGITTEVALRSGIEIASALEAFAKDAIDAKVIVAHNVLFDEGVVSGEFIRAGRHETPLAGKISYCTMQSSTDFCKIKGRRGYKWPRLEELHILLFGDTFESAHSALADVRACAKCFFELKRRGIISGKETPRAVQTGHTEEMSEDEQYEIEDLFEQIEGLSETIWKSERKWVDIIYGYFQKNHTISTKQRSILEDILSKLEDR
jgi:DNA polymerase III epsilon subunit-like protein